MSLFGCDYFTPDTAHALRAECGRDARAWATVYLSEYRTARPNGMREPAPTELRSHYNSKDHRCYAELVYYISETPEGLGPNFHIETLVDVDENHPRGFAQMQIGGNAMTRCSVAAADCKTFSEWDELTKPYMER